MTIGGKALLLIKLTPFYGRSCCDSCPSACLKLLLVILRSFPACILMSVGPEAMADVVRWCQEKRLDLGEEPRPRALFYFFGRMDCLFCWPRRRCFFALVRAVSACGGGWNKRWSGCKRAVSLGKIRMCRGTRSSASHTSEARATQVLSSKGPAATGPFHGSLRYPLLLIFSPDRVEVWAMPWETSYPSHSLEQRRSNGQSNL